jgi:hypothetical protein
MTTQPKTSHRTQPGTGVVVYPVYDRKGNVRWVSVPKN